MAIAHIAAVLDAGGLSGSEKLLLVGYCNHTDSHGYCWPSVPRLADETGMSERTVKRANVALRERGLIKSVRRVNQRTGEPISNLTRVNLDLLSSMKRPAVEYDDNLIEEITFGQVSGTGQDDTPSDLLMCQPDTPSVTDWHLPRGQSGTDLGDKVAPKSSVEPSEESSSQSGRPSAEALVLDLGATEDEMTRVLNLIKNRHKPDNLTGYVIKMARERDLAGVLAEVRKAKAREPQPLPPKCDDPRHDRNARPDDRMLVDAEGLNPTPCPRCSVSAAAKPPTPTEPQPWDGVLRSVV